MEHVENVNKTVDKLENLKLELLNLKTVLKICKDVLEFRKTELYNYKPTDFDTIIYNILYEIGISFSDEKSIIQFIKIKKKRFNEIKRILLELGVYNEDN